MDENLKKIIRENPPSDEEIKRMAQSVASFMAKLLRQEYRWNEGAWWLFSLGEPARPLTDDEVADAKARGAIQR